MTLPMPNLDDRSFEQLMAEARQQIAHSCPDWTDLSPGDPGIVLLELFAHLTEMMIYRLNRLPQNAYIAFLRLLGVTLYPPAAAAVMLHISRDQALEQQAEIPRGTRVTMGRTSGGSEPPVFVTARPVTIPPGETAVAVMAHHCELVTGEWLGVGSGLPGLSFTVKRAPITAPTGDELDLVVAVETPTNELDERAQAIQFNGKAYRVWREVDNFTNVGPDPFVYVTDRLAGTITFAPAARLEKEAGRLEDIARPLAAVPPAGREVRAWYRHGGGPTGNVTANTLNTFKDPLPGLKVTNPAPASGGQAAETLDNALVRGPHELRSLRRAVSARDFELVALTSARGIARARAITRGALWRHAVPGTVEILLVPRLPEADEGSRTTMTQLRQQETEVMRGQIQGALDARRPLGTNCVVHWAHYKTARVTARIVISRHENPTAVRERVLKRLYQTITPLPTAVNSGGWPFGQALRASDIYTVALAEPGVRWVDQVQLLVDEVPEKQVTAVAADFYQPQTWYAGSGTTLFRSLNAGHGWEPATYFAETPIGLIRPHPYRAGLVVVATQLPEEGGSQIHLSQDCGETWALLAQFGFGVTDMTWMLRGEGSVLLLATEQGLYELAVQPGSSPVQLVIDPADQDQGLYAVVAITDTRGMTSVAAATHDLSGIYLSNDGGRTGTFRYIGLRGEDIRTLAVQHDGPRSFLWAGASAAGAEDPGKGCFRWELRGTEDPPEGWLLFGEAWTGGSCRGIAFLGTKVIAASHRAGVLWLEPARTAVWQPPAVRCGLPLRDPGRFHPVETLAVDPRDRLLMVGGVEGVYRCQDEGVSYQASSAREFLEKVTLPETWLFVSGEHDINVVSEDEAQ